MAFIISLWTIRFMSVVYFLSVATYIQILKQGSAFKNHYIENFRHYDILILTLKNGDTMLYIFMDEAGDHSLDKIDPDFPVFVLVMIACDVTCYSERTRKPRSF